METVLGKPNSTESSNSEQQLTAQAKQDEVDADKRKLEAIESARDPAYLLKAQILLQAQKRPKPDNNGKTW